MEKIKIESTNIKEVKKTTFKYAVKNAYEHKGKAQLGAVVGKVKALHPKVNLNEAIKTIKETVEEVNTINKEQLKEQYELYQKTGWELKQVEKEKTLPELNWLNGKKVITRAAPCPTGPMHFGHARPYILTDMFVKKYGGKYIMRFDDTDPKVKIPEKKYEKEFLNDFKWLGIKIDKCIAQSDRIDRYHKIIEYLLAEGNAYVCFCDSKEWRNKIWQGKACPCREKNVQEQLKEWKKMLKWEYKEGKCVVRIKTDLKNKDSSVRDYWIAKIVDDPTKHPNKKTHKTHVWPAYNLASAVDDHDMKINFSLRGQEHIQNETKQKYIYKYFNWEYPHTIYNGKVSKVGDMVLSKSKIKTLMEKEGLTRDDDPRLARIKSFRRRGFKPEAIRKVIFDLGINPNDAKISMENLAAENKKALGNVNNYNTGKGTEIEILMNDGNLKTEKVDETIKKEKIGEVVQLNKIGFVKIEEINKKVKAVFTHK